MHTQETARLEQAIAALEAQRGVLGEAVVQAALTSLRERLNSLRAASQQERKFATILFAEIPGLAALSEQIDAEDLQESSQALWNRLDEVVGAFGGQVDKHMGQGVMAVWGMSAVSEDDPSQAARAALEMQITLSEFCRQSPRLKERGLSLRAGINSGPVIIGALGTTGEITAIGDAVNLAARLQQSAAPGQILASGDTYRLTRGIFDVEMLPPLQVKGKSEPVHCYRILQAKPRAFYLPAPSLEGIQTRLIGRSAEMEHLQQAYFDLFELRHPQVALIRGEMGLGKSRLIAEFMAWTDPRPEDYLLFQARCAPSQSASPFALLRELFLFRFQIQDSDCLASVRAKMENGFENLMPDDPRAEEKAHIIGQLLGFDFSHSPYLKALRDDPRQIRSLGLRALTRFFESAARQYPVILFLDDLHWGDSASLEALRQVFQSLSATTPLLAVCAARPEIEERFPNWSSGLRNLISLRLAPLSREESRALTAEILQKVESLPSSLREMIVNGGEGNPFYMEELVKMLVDGGALDTQNGVWRLNLSRLDSLSVPSTLAGVLQARLDALNEEQRLSLQRASVIGRIFWDKALEALTLPEEESALALEASLAGLRERELIHASPVSSFAEAQEFSFKHALLRDVTYATVLKRQRTEYHTRAADWLWRASGERRREYLPIIAEHYERAAQDEKAAATLLEAGENALRVSAFSEAFRFFQRAAALLPAQRRRDQAVLQLKMGEVFLRSGEYADALKHSSAALQAARELSASDLLPAAMYQVGQILTETGKYAEAEQLLNEALPLARALGQRAASTLPRLLYGLGNVQWRLGMLESAYTFCQESRQMAEKIGDVNTYLLATNRLGVISGLRGDSAAEKALYQEGLASAQQAGNRECAAILLNNLGSLADERNDPQEAETFYLQAIELARELGLQQSLSLYLLNLGHGQIRLGNLAAAQTYLLEGMALARHLGADPWTLTAVIFFARLEGKHGHWPRAWALIGLAERHSAFSPDHRRLVEQILAECPYPPQAIESGKVSGQALQWEETLNALLQDNL